MLRAITFAAVVACSCATPTAPDVAIAVERGTSRVSPTLAVAAPRVTPGSAIAFEVRWVNNGAATETLHFGACASPLALLRNGEGRVDVVIGEGEGGIGFGGSCVDTPVDTVVAPGEHVTRTGTILATTRTTSPFAEPPVEDHIEPLARGTYTLEVMAPRTDGKPGFGEVLTAEIVVAE